MRFTPFVFGRWRGYFSEVVSNSCDWITRWAMKNRCLKERLTANFVATCSPANDVLVLYFVPRSRDKLNFGMVTRVLSEGRKFWASLLWQVMKNAHWSKTGNVDYKFIENALNI